MAISNCRVKTGICTEIGGYAGLVPSSPISPIAAIFWGWDWYSAGNSLSHPSSRLVVSNGDIPIAAYKFCGKRVALVQDYFRGWY